MINESNKYTGSKSFKDVDEFKAPNLEFNEKREYTELQGKKFETADPVYDKAIIEKAIQTSDLGINPQNDGKLIRLIFPQITEDHRRSIVKDVSKMAEDTKVTIRSVRRDSIDKFKKMKKDSLITEDDLSVAEKQIQDLTDKFCSEIDNISSKKQKEVMEI